MNRASAPSQALLLHCPRCGQAFAEMIALIEHPCAGSPSTTPVKRSTPARDPRRPAAVRGRP